MKIRINMIIVIMITFCFTATLFMVIPIRSSDQPYNPWIDTSENGVIDLADLVKLATSYGALAPNNDTTKNVNVTNWPQDRPLTIKKGVDKIVLVQAMDGGTSNGFALSLGKPSIDLGQVAVAFLVYDFEPKGQLVNVSEIYLNLVWRGDVGGTLSNPHNVSMAFFNGPREQGAEYDSINLSTGYGEPCDNMPTGVRWFANAVRDYKTDFNYALIQPGMLLVELYRFDTYGDHIFIFSLEMFIEYYYWS